MAEASLPLSLATSRLHLYHMVLPVVKYCGSLSQEPYHMGSLAFPEPGLGVKAG